MIPTLFRKLANKLIQCALLPRGLPPNSIKKIKMRKKCIFNVSDNLKVIIISKGQFIEAQFSAFAVWWGELRVLLQPV